MKISEPKPILAALLCFFIFATQETANASWLSDITGVNIDVPRGQITFGPPRPDRIPLMLQHLPQDVGQFFLNPVGGALALAIRQAKELARQDCQPVPPNIQQSLSPFIPPAAFNGVCWSLYRGDFSLDSLLLGQEFKDINAVTLEDVIVFKDSELASRPDLWAHEMIHVLQYRRLGVETFAYLYSSGASQAIENDAYSFQNFVASRLPMNLSHPGPYWFTQPGWDPQTRLTEADYSQAAKQAINPMTCIKAADYVQEGVRVVRISNTCPIPVRVTYFILENLTTGQQREVPCITQACMLPPNMWSQWPEDGFERTAGEQVVW